jgi:hypothetical protein
VRQPQGVVGKFFDKSAVSSQHSAVSIQQSAAKAEVSCTPKVRQR